MEVCPKMVLCIGEDHSTLNDIRHALVAEGFSVLLARNGKEGLFLANHRLIIDAVVVGLEMPDIHVFELVRSIRSVVPTTPVIMYSDASRPILLGLPGFVTDFVPRTNLCELVSLIRKYTEGSATSRKRNVGITSDCART